jgi:PASTA domain
VLVASLAVAAAPAVAAVTLPAPAGTITPEESDTAPIRDYDGVMLSLEIRGLESPERYPLRVDLARRQELRQVSPTEVQVIYVDGTESFAITAEKARDAEGARVPTTLEMTGEDEITLTVHHRAGNPAAGGAPFDYPITAGEGWEGGPFQTVIVKGPPDDTELREMSERERMEREIIEASPAAQVEPLPVITCRVPTLRGYSLRGAKNRLRVAHCGIGAVHLAAGATVGKGKVVKQFYAVGSELAAGAPVAVKLGSRG